VLNFSTSIAATLLLVEHGEGREKVTDVSGREKGVGRPLLAHFSIFGGANVLMGAKL
jgi:hypothetical protein